MYAPQKLLIHSNDCSLILQEYFLAAEKKHRGFVIRKCYPFPMHAYKEAFILRSSAYQEKYIDSRLCPDITNISINVSPVIEVAGLSGVRPGPAHMGYDQDDRVIGLIAHGIGNPNTSPLVKERCELIRTIE